MRVWPALLLAPLLALASIGFGYALVPSACSPGTPWLLHGLILGCLALTVASTLYSWTGRKQRGDPFLTLVAVWNGAFFSLVIALQWTMQLFLSPCMP
jgi:sugar phosphate permease